MQASSTSSLVGTSLRLLTLDICPSDFRRHRGSRTRGLRNLSVRRALRTSRQLFRQFPKRRLKNSIATGRWVYLFYAHQYIHRRKSKQSNQSGTDQIGRRRRRVQDCTYPRKEQTTQKIHQHHAKWKRERVRREGEKPEGNPKRRERNGEKEKEKKSSSQKLIHHGTEK